MNKFLLLVALNICSLVCAVGAIYMAIKGVEGWGWVLFVGAIFTSFPSSSKTE